MDNNTVKELKAAIARGAKSLKNPAKEGETHSRQTADAHAKRGEEVAKLVNSSYEVVADYLFTEGYADSFESALIVADVISDEWFGDILEVKITPMSPARLASFQKRVAAADAREQRTGSRLTRSEQDALAKIRARLDAQQTRSSPVQSSLNMGQERKKSTIKRGSFEVR
jgi:hypothetical protein